VCRHQIRRLTDEVADLEHAEKKLEKKIRETKVHSASSNVSGLIASAVAELLLLRCDSQDKWLPELRKLVKNFNKKFSDAMDSACSKHEALGLDESLIRTLAPLRQASTTGARFASASTRTTRNGQSRSWSRSGPRTSSTC
jgi:hypothetical protein